MSSLGFSTLRVQLLIDNSIDLFLSKFKRKSCIIVQSVFPYNTDNGGEFVILYLNIAEWFVIIIVTSDAKEKN
jgi:hypothetical protein